MSKRTAIQHAADLLARREHSATELEQKLKKASHPDDEIEAAIADLQEKNLQSDSRFAEQFVRNRIQRGLGEMRIRQELKQRGVDSTIQEDALAEAETDWFELAYAVRCKRFGEEVPEEPRQRAKQQRFLQYRGFTYEQITQTFERSR